MGEISINPKHNVHKKYREVIYVNPFLATPPVVVPVANTFIGGVASTLYSPALLAAKLAIDVSRISAFEVVGSDIKCKITGSYIFPNSVFDIIQGNANTLTYYDDSDSLVTGSVASTFFQMSALTRINLKGLTKLQSRDFTDTRCIEYLFPNVTEIFGDLALRTTTGKYFYLPKCTAYGTSPSTSDNTFAFSTSGVTIYAHPSLQTINYGGVEADLAAAISQGATVRYVTNFTAPNPVTTLSVGTIYKTAIQFIDNGSTNPIDYYEITLNGTYYGRVKVNDYIIGLNASTSYSISGYAVDIFYNKSVVNNSLSVTTNNTSAVPLTGLVSYYKLDSSSIDSYGTNNGVDTAVTYGVGKIGNGAIYNGSTSKTVIGNPANLQLSQGTICAWIKTSNAGSSYKCIFSKVDAYGLYLVDGVLMLYNWGSFGGAGNRSTGINLNDGISHHVALVFESGTALNYIYIDSVLRLTFSMSVLNQSSGFQIGSSFNSTTQNINAVIDEVVVYSAKLTENQIQLIYNNGNGITL